MTQIHGSRPRTFPSCIPDHQRNRYSLIRLYSSEGVESTVPDGEVLIVPEHGSGCDGVETVRHEFPAGTKFRLVRSGNPREVSITEILDHVDPRSATQSG